MMSLRIRIGRAVLLWLVVIAPPTFSYAAEPPQEPLTLSAALRFAATTHPVLKSAELDLESARIEYDAASMPFNPTIDLTILGQRADRAAPDAPGSVDDSRSSLRITQRLFDSGGRESLKTAGELSIHQAQRQLQNDIQQHRILIMRRYLDVLLADLDYAVKNELMTITFLKYNRLQEQFDMFESPAEVDVLAAQSRYMDAFVVRQQAGMQPQNARRKLGIAMGLEGYVPRDLTAPNVDALVDRELPDFDVLLEQVLESNADLAVAKLRISEAENRSASDDARFKPSVDGIVEGTSWTQRTGSRNEASVSLRINIPLHSGTQRDRTRRLNRIAVDKARAHAQSIELTLRERTFDLWHKLRTLLVEVNAAEVNSAYRDQYMDRSRMLYELEVRSDLGDAQAQLLGASRRMTQARYEVALAWAQLDVMMGKKVFPDEN